MAKKDLQICLQSVIDKTKKAEKAKERKEKKEKKEKAKPERHTHRAVSTKPLREFVKDESDAFPGIKLPESKTKTNKNTPNSPSPLAEDEKEKKEKKEEKKLENKKKNFQGGKLEKVKVQKKKREMPANGLPCLEQRRVNHQ